jgi:hypothetical protein
MIGPVSIVQATTSALAAEWPDPADDVPGEGAGGQAAQCGGRTTFDGNAVRASPRAAFT